ncbi:Fic family protein [Eubacteriales bacterium OttesenSCG-928-M02]|nr:Fic family protein [Eubacteriales bacterium OttesenSCG-928-M02]
MPTWKIKYEPGIDENNPDIRRLITLIEASRIALSSIPLPPGIRREQEAIHVANQIKGTTRLEGNNLSDEEVEVAIGKESSESIDENAIIGGVRLHKYIVSNASPGIPVISEELIKELHNCVVGLLPEDEYRPGKYRLDGPITVGKNYFPPKFDEIKPCMKEYIEFINSEEAMSWNPIIRAVAAHFYLVTIHPFENGNGRASRAIEAYILYCGGYNKMGFYSLSNFYYEHRDDYFDMLDKTRFAYKGDLSKFVLFALSGFEESLSGIVQDASIYLTRKMYVDYVKERLRLKDIDKRGFLIASVLGEGNIAIRKEDILPESDHWLRESLGKYSKRTLDRSLKKLSDIDLIVIEDGLIKPNYDVMKKFRE